MKRLLLAMTAALPLLGCGGSEEGLTSEPGSGPMRGISCSVE